MKLLVELTQLFESSEKQIASLKKKISDLKAEKAALIANHAGSGFQSGIDPRYANRIKQLDAAIKAAGYDLTAALKRPEAEQEIRAAAQASANIPKPSHGDLVKRGVERWKKLADEFGSEAGLNHEIKRVAMHMTSNGRHPLDIKQLAIHFDVSESTLRRRLEQSSLIGLLRLLPNAKPGVDPSAVVRARNKIKYGDK